MCCGSLGNPLSLLGRHTLVGVLATPVGTSGDGVGVRSANDNAGPAWDGNEVVVLVHGAMANKNSFYHKHLAVLHARSLSLYIYMFLHARRGAVISTLPGARCGQKKELEKS